MWAAKRFLTTSRAARFLLFTSLCTLAIPSVHGEWPEFSPLQSRSAGSYLGLGLQDLERNRAKALKLPEVSGVEIVGVEEGAAGDKAGIHVGDVVLSYNGEKILGAQQFIRLVAETPQGRRVPVVIWRNGEKQEVWVTTGAVRADTAFEDFDAVMRGRISDIPSPLMLWRNVILGIESTALSEQLAETMGVKQGILVWSVNAGSLAQRAGLRAGDVVIGFCGHKVRSPRELGLTLQQLQPGRKSLAIDLVREHKALSLTIAFQGDR